MKPSLRKRKTSKTSDKDEQKEVVLSDTSPKKPATKSKSHLKLIFDALNRKRTFFLFGLLLGSLIITVTINQTLELQRLNIQHFLWKHFPSLQGINSDILANITSFVTENLANTELPAHSLASTLKPKHPVFIVPGITSTNLESWARGGCAESYFRKKVWGDITMASSLLLDKECWLQNLMLDPETGLDPENIKLRPVQGIDAANYFMPGYWVWAKIMENLAIIGYDSNNMYMAAYDWRLSIQNLEKRDGYFSKLKANIELNYRIHGQKVVIISHSMGGNIVHYFLKWVESRSAGPGSYKGWVDDHVHAVVDIAIPYLGVPKTIPAILSGETRDTGAVDQLKDERYTRSFGNLVSFRKKAELSATSKNYTANNFFELLHQFTPSSWRNALKQYSHGISLYDLDDYRFDQSKYWTNPLQRTLPDAPSIKLFSLYGVGKSTERAYMYDYSESVISKTVEVLDESAVSSNRSHGAKVNTTLKQQNDRVVGLHVDTEVNIPDEEVFSGVQETDGDGTVPLLSLGYMPMAGWRHGGDRTYGHIFNPSKVKIVSREYFHDPLPLVKDPRGGPASADHVDILGNHELTVDILKIVAGKDHEVDDRFFSNIREMAKEIKLDEVEL